VSPIQIRVYISVNLRQLVFEQQLTYATAELQQKAKDIINYRQQKIREQQADKDYEIICKKAELHYAEYCEMRQQQLQKGRRINALYRSKRAKETIDNNKGPQLCVVVKG